MARSLNVAGECAVLVLGVALLAAGVSSAEQRASLAGTAQTGAGCRLTAAAPTEANDLITGTGSIRCKKSRMVHIHIETQALEQGQWGTFGSFDGFPRVRARRSREVSTGPANCKGLGQVQMRTVLKLVQFPRTLAEATSPSVQIACSSAHP